MFQFNLTNLRIHTGKKNKKIKTKGTKQKQFLMLFKINEFLNST